MILHFSKALSWLKVPDWRPVATPFAVAMHLDKCCRSHLLPAPQEASFQGGGPYQIMQTRILTMLLETPAACIHRRRRSKEAPTNQAGPYQLIQTHDTAKVSLYTHTAYLHNQTSKLGESASKPVQCGTKGSPTPPSSLTCAAEGRSAQSCTSMPKTFARRHRHCFSQGSASH